VRDVARVGYGYEERQFVVRQSGQPALIFGVLRKTGSNTLEVMEGVREVIARLNQRYGDRGIEIRIVYDATIYIEEAIDLVTTNLLIGATLATAVLLLFLRSRSAVLVLGFSIPISIVTTFLFLFLFGRSLNIISLAGLTFATGMVLDNAIVVLENIFRHREMGRGLLRAAADGAVEVWGAILASTLTTLAVFIPIILVEEEAGQIFRDIAIAISIAIAFSLVVSITVIPMLSARLLRTPPRTRRATGEARAGLVVRAVTGVLAWMLASAPRKTIVIAGIVVAALVTVGQALPELDYLPEGNRNMVFVQVRTPPGYNLRQNERIVRLLEERILVQPEVHRMFAVVRHEGPFQGVVLREEYKDKDSIRDFIERLRELTRDIPGARDVFIRQAPLIRRGRMASGKIEVLIRGDDLDVIRTASETLEPRIRDLDGINFVNPSFEIGQPEFVVDVDRVRATELGLTVAQVGTLVETLVHGIQVGTFDDAGREIDLLLRTPEGSIGSMDDLSRAVLYTPTQQTVQLGDVARIRFREGPTRIEHTDMDRSVKLFVDVGEIPLAEMAERIETVVAPVRAGLPLGHDIEITGQASDLQRTWTAFRGAFLLALLITYLLLASLFESFRIPLVILVTVPFATSGGVVGLRLLQVFDTTVKLDTITMLGFVILIGVVVNNAILLVHQTLNRLRDGLDSHQALLEGVRGRIRPVFMTMTTTVVGMSPLVLAGGSGSELYRGLGATLIGGLVLSTLFTLFLVPGVLSFLLPARADERATSAVAAGR
jgi:HAE1 family hydrophobic/amphiphilic exporter-1